MHRDVKFQKSEHNRVAMATPTHTHLKEVVEADVAGLRPVHRLVVVEEEPVGDANVKQIRVVPVQPYKIQPSLVAVPPTEIRPGGTNYQINLTPA